MITHLLVRDPTLAIVPWWSQVETLRTLTSLDFKPGLNLLWGRNGAGKSTILRALARLTCSEQGGRSVVTETAIADYFEATLGGHPERARFGLALDHDAQAVVSLFGGTKYGLRPGGIDDDFTAEGLESLCSGASAGQAQLALLDKALLTHMQRPQQRPTTTGNKRTPLLRRQDMKRTPAETSWPEVEWRIREGNTNSLWAERVRLIREHLFTPRFPAGLHTVLLDEPDQSLDIDMQARLWAGLPRFVQDKNLQVICATHSVFASDIPDAHYVELTPGYLSEVRAALKGRFV